MIQYTVLLEEVQGSVGVSFSLKNVQMCHRVMANLTKEMKMWVLCSKKERRTQREAFSSILSPLKIFFFQPNEKFSSIAFTLELAI